jgi:hypothetical protein
MASKGRSNLNKNERGISTNFFGNYDPFQEREWVKGKNTIRELFDITPINTNSARGGLTSIEIDKRGDRLGKMFLSFQVAPITGGIPVDYEGPNSIDNIIFYYANKPFHQLYGEQLTHETILRPDIQARSALNVQEGGNLSLMERTRAAATTRTFFVDLKVPWAKLKKQLRMVALPNKIRMDIQWNLQSKVIQDAVSGTTATGGLISTVFCRCEFTHRKSMDRDREFQQVHAQPLNWKYWSYEFHRRENVNANASTGLVNPVKIQLRNIKNDSVQIYATLRNQSDVDQTTSGTVNPYNFLDFTGMQFWLEDNGTQITDYWTLDKYARYIETGRAYPGHEPGTWNFMVINLVQPEMLLASEDDCYGSRCISKYNNPTFCVQWTNGGGGNNALWLDIWSLTHNIMIQHKGDLRKFLQ